MLNFLKAEEITPFIIRKHILKIRKAKISDPKEHPNVGSFFKNPIISLDELEKIGEPVKETLYQAQTFKKHKSRYLINKTNKT